jgi:hypothetical protein
MDREKFMGLMRAYAAIQPWRAPDFTKPEVAWYYYQELKNYSFDELKIALDRHIKKADHFPSLREIHLVAGKGQIDDSTRSSIIAMNIIAAIRKFGWNNYKEAMAYIGPEGEKVVNLMGGWQHLSDAISDSNLSYMQNTIKDNAASLLRSNYDFTQALPSGKTQQLIEGLSRDVDTSSKRVGNTKRNLRLAIPQGS